MRTDDFNINVVVLSKLAEMLVAGLDYAVPLGYFLVGASSHHDDRKE